MLVQKSLSKSLLIYFRYRISTEVIKKYQQDLTKKSSSLIQQYPRTFQDKVQLLNNPTMIQAIQIVQFGVNYKPGKKWLVIILFMAGLLGYFHQKTLPTKVIDRYFTISPQSNKYLTGYLGATLMYSQNKPFYLYLPLLTVVYQMTRFIQLRHLCILGFMNFITNSVLGKYLVDRRLSQYEVWNQERIMYGDGMLLSMAFGFWALLGFKDGLNSLKAKIFLKAVPGLGIVRQGIPVALFCIFYTLIQAGSYYKNSRNSELVAVSIINGIIFGLLLRRFKPLIK